jgi:hypothetical protein
VDTAARTARCTFQYAFCLCDFISLYVLVFTDVHWYCAEPKEKAAAAKPADKKVKSSGWQNPASPQPDSTLIVGCLYCLFFSLNSSITNVFL